MPAPLVYGDVIWLVDAPDKGGREDKSRPCIVLRVDDVKGVVVAVTSSFEEEALEHYQVKVYVDGQDFPDTETSFTGPCVADCQWWIFVTADECQVVGKIPKALLPGIAKRVNYANRNNTAVKKQTDGHKDLAGEIF